MSANNSNTQSRTRSARRTRRNNSRNTKLLKYDEEIASLRRQISRMNARLLDLENKKRLLVLENTEPIYNTIPELRESSNSNSELEFDLTAGPRPPPLLTPSPSPPLPLPPSSDISPDYSQIPKKPPANFEALYSGQNSIIVGEGPNIYESRFRQPGASARRPSLRPSLIPSRRPSSRPSRRNSPNVYESISLPRGISARKSTLRRPSRRPSNIRRNTLGGGSRKTRKIRKN